MEFQFCSGASSLQLKKAILFYENVSGPSNGLAYASIHNIADVGIPGKPQLEILAGTPLTQRAVLQTLGKMAKQISVSTEILPENVLSHSPTHLVWWVPAGNRNVFFKSESVGVRSGPTSHPPLVFIVSHGKWSVFAIKKNKRPEKDTPLFHAPYFNVYDDGRICVGSSAVPKNHLPENIAVWNAAFFNSEFTQAHGSIKKIKGDVSLAGFWKEQLLGAYKRFPTSRLVDRQLILGHAVNAATKGA